MIILAFIIGGMFGLIGMGIFAADAYNKGFADGAGDNDQD